jgi:hypothetical protein
VILVTDGEETCGGDPGATIEQLQKAGLDVRVNIVGFAVDDAKLAATFRHWADTGRGRYFDAADAAGLGKALSQATLPAVEVIAADGRVVAKGLADAQPLTVMPGDYKVRLTSRPDQPQSVTVRSGETATVRF